MKLKIKVVALVLVVATLVTGFGFAAEQKVVSAAKPVVEVDILTQERLDGLVADIDPEVMERMILQAPALEAVERMRQALTDEDGNVVYGDEYAGEYLDDEKKLVIRLVGRTPEMEDYYRNLFGGYERLVFADAQYSLNSLEMINDMAALLCDNYSISGYGVDVINNSFRIFVDNFDFNNLKSFLSRTRNSMPITLEVSTEMEMHAAVDGGTRAYAEGNGTATLAIGGTYNGNDAFLTCGHGGMAVGNSVKRSSDGKIIGTVAFNSHNNFEKNLGNTVKWSGDYAIIKAATGYTKTRVMGGEITSIGTTTPVVGTDYYRYGAESGLGLVKVTANGQTINLDGKDCFVDNISYFTNYYNAPIAGDSGGAFFVYRFGGYYFVGLHHGTNNGNYCFTSKSAISGFDF